MHGLWDLYSVHVSKWAITYSYKYKTNLLQLCEVMYRHGQACEDSNDSVLQ